MGGGYFASERVRLGLSQKRPPKDSTNSTARGVLLLGMSTEATYLNHKFHVRSREMCGGGYFASERVRLGLSQKKTAWDSTDSTARGVLLLGMGTVRTYHKFLVRSREMCVGVFCVRKG